MNKNNVKSLYKMTVCHFKPFKNRSREGGKEIYKPDGTLLKNENTCVASFALIAKPRSKPQKRVKIYFIGESQRSKIRAVTLRESKDLWI